MRKYYFVTPIIVSIIITVAGIIFFITISINPSFNDGSGQINPTLSSNFGDFVAGVLGPLFSFASILLLISSITLQLSNTQKDNFENRLFQLLNFHRENINTMFSVDNKVSGRHVFTQMRNTLSTIINISSTINKQKGSMLTDEEIAELSFLILFFGLSKNDASTLIYNLIDYESEESVKKYTDVVSSILYAVSNSVAENSLSQQSNLGHYFRNLYQTVKFVDDAWFLSKKEKYKYVKMVRTQLSQYELVIFFFNTFTKYARPWKSENLIVKYRFIKNLPKGLCFSYDPKKYFDITYEWEEFPSK